MLFVLIGVFAALGAWCRYGLTLSLVQAEFPLGTLLANVLGSFLIGVLFYLRQRQVVIVDEAVHMALMVGFLGAFTTFSAFSLDTMRLADQGALGMAAANVLLNVFLCLFVCILGTKFTATLLSLWLEK